MKPIITKSLQVQPSASETFSEKNAGIKFAVGESSLGSILVACGDQGVLASSLATIPESWFAIFKPNCRKHN
jgi:hypothetical protein